MDYKRIGPPLLRIAMSLVFLYFGFNQIYSPDAWTGFVPDFLTHSVLTANNIVMANGIMELILGTFLLIGLYTRFSSLVLALHLVGIALPMIATPTGIRDLGLAVATFVIFLNGFDEYTIDKKFEKK